MVGFWQQEARFVVSKGGGMCFAFESAQNKWNIKNVAILVHNIRFHITTLQTLKHMVLYKIKMG